jgi:hypothetical protein
VRDSGYGFALANVPGNLPQYAVILLVMFPLAALLPWWYRGERRPELTTAVVLYVAFFLLYGWNSVRENGPLKGVMLTSRFMIPALPVLTFMAAEVIARASRARSATTRAMAWRVASAFLVLLAVAAFGIHAAVSRMERASRSMIATIDRYTSPETPILTNEKATLKYLSPVYAPRRLILRGFVTTADLPRLVGLTGSLDVVFLDRVDSDMFREDAALNARWIADAGNRCALRSVYAAPELGGARLRILHISSCT